MSRLVDAHIHLTDPNYASYIRYLEQMIHSMNLIMICVSVDLYTSQDTLLLNERWGRRLIPFCGIHPRSAPRIDLQEFLKFFQSQENRIMGVGEIGLDRKYVSNEDFYDLQLRVFDKMLEVAERSSKPISIHSRGFLDEVIERIKTYRISQVLLHWFTGSTEKLRKVCDLGYYISFGPALVYSKPLKRLAQDADHEYILTETDGPVQFGACYSGRQAMPSFLPSVLFTLSNLLKIDFEEAVELIYRNSSRYLGVDL